MLFFDFLGMGVERWWYWGKEIVKSGFFKLFIKGNLIFYLKDCLVNLIFFGLIVFLSLNFLIE